MSVWPIKQVQGPQTCTMGTGLKDMLSPRRAYFWCYWRIMNNENPCWGRARGSQFGELRSELRLLSTTVFASSEIWYFLWTRHGSFVFHYPIFPYESSFSITVYCIWWRQIIYHLAHGSQKHELHLGLRDKVAYHTRVPNFKPDMVLDATLVCSPCGECVQWWGRTASVDVR